MANGVGSRTSFFTTRTTPFASHTNSRPSGAATMCVAMSMVDAMTTLGELRRQGCPGGVQRRLLAGGRHGGEQVRFLLTASGNQTTNYNILR